MPFLNPDRKPHIIHPSGHPIDVITSHNSLGAIKPLYFRLEDDRQERFTFMLSKSHLRKEERGIMTFDYEYVAYGRVNWIVLVFDVTRCQWSVG